MERLRSHINLMFGPKVKTLFVKGVHIIQKTTYQSILLSNVNSQREKLSIYCFLTPLVVTLLQYNLFITLIWAIAKRGSRVTCVFVSLGSTNKVIGRYYKWSNFLSSLLTFIQENSYSVVIHVIMGFQVCF